VTAEKVNERHLDRKAILYIRQSSQYQVEHHEEGRRLQYAMRDRLLALGWRDVDVIDEDLGLSGASASARVGFQRMVAEVCLGKVGVVAAHEVSRFARNNRDWSQLIEMCSLVDTLLIDHEAIYDARRGNDRLLLGLKGSLSEYELDLLRQRSLEARKQMAARGELVLHVPVGYVKPGDALEKDPDRRVQKALASVFERLMRLGSVRQTLMWFLENDVQLPVTQPATSGYEVAWRRPSYALVMRLLRNPVYAGAYAYGRTGARIVIQDGAPTKTRVWRPREEWAVLIRDHHEGYVAWDRFEKIQSMIEGNGFRAHTGPGAARDGAALLAGLLRCRRCGRKLVVAHTGRNHSVPRYTCVRGFLDVGEPKCLSFGGTSVDAAVCAQVLEVVQPAAIEAARSSASSSDAERGGLLEALKLDLEAARYSAGRAFKQYDRVDPENRLVAAELERRWESATARVRELEQRVDAERCALERAPVVDAATLGDLAHDLAAIWSDSQDVRLKKRILRTVIEEIAVDVDIAASEVDVVIHWRGGVHTQLRVRRRKKGENAAHTSKDIVDAIRALSHVASDQLIAGYLNRNGRLTGRGNRWTREFVTSLRSKQQIPVFSAANKATEGWLILKEAAALVGVSPQTLRLSVERGAVPAMHPLPDGPWIFRRSDLERPDITKLVLVGKDPTKPCTDQREFDFPTT
jgi:DNA invertase Pin-like site-specific DNA recombinase